MRGLVLLEKEYLHDSREARQPEGYNYCHIIKQGFMKFRPLSAWRYFCQYPAIRREELCRGTAPGSVLEPQRLLQAQTLNMKKERVIHIPSPRILLRDCAISLCKHTLA